MKIMSLPVIGGSTNNEQSADEWAAQEKAESRNHDANNSSCNTY